jgi:hypothetical protein
MPINERMTNTFFEGDWWLKKKEAKGHKGTNKKEKLKQLAFYYSKFFKNELTQDDVGSVCYIHFKHHWIGLDIQNISNTMEHYFTTTLNCHTELGWTSKTF